VLKGEAPGEIAVQGVEITELHVNPGAAKKMGVTIPPEVIAEAKKVIE
jgi:putative ABC transport system substrate-binding protein